MENLPFYLSEFNWFSVLDILLVTLAIFAGLRLVSGTRAVQVLRGFIIAALALVLLSTVFQQLVALRWLVTTTLPALIVAIPVIFQPELRRAFAQLGDAGGIMRFFRPVEEEDEMIEAIAEASRLLSNEKEGALIILERDTGLQEFIDTGVSLDAEISVRLLQAIFNKETDLHDGGVIIRDGRIAAAACIMPLSSNQEIDASMGLRHRAALGTSEQTDAVVVVVSEESGKVSIAHNARILPNQPQAQLERILKAFLSQRNQRQGVLEV